MLRSPRPPNRSPLRRKVFSLFPSAVASDQGVLMSPVIEKRPLVPPPEVSPMLLGKEPSEYLLYVLTRIKSANLESALLVLSFSQVLTMLKYLEVRSISFFSLAMVLIFRLLGLDSREQAALPLLASALLVDPHASSADFSESHTAHHPRVPPRLYSQTSYHGTSPSPFLSFFSD